MSAVLALANPHRIKASHRRRRKVASGRFVQRYYDPMLGRFLSADPDPSDTKTGWNFNRYNYAANNPYKFTDPDGRAVSCSDTSCQGESHSVFEAAVDYATVAVAYSSRVLENAAVEFDVATSAVTAVAKYYLNEATGADADSPNSDGTKTSDREPGTDGKRGSTGGPGEGKRFPNESPGTKAGKDGQPCRYCGQETTNKPGQPNSRERDHIDPKSRGGNNSPENEGDSCRDCNRGKGARNPDEWKPKEGGTK